MLESNTPGITGRGFDEISHKGTEGALSSHALKKTNLPRASYCFENL